jgi:AcrR family transcriptional regulator
MIHEAFLYSSDDEFTERLAPFLRQAIREQQGALAVTTQHRISLLRRALGSDASAVTFVDSANWYRRPGATLVSWRDALDQLAREGVPFVRAIGEIEFGNDDVAARNWQRYEFILNRAFTDRPAWIVCPYDTRVLPEEILVTAGRTHPTTSTVPDRVPSPAYFAGPEVAAPIVPAEALPGAEGRTRAALTSLEDILEMRSGIRWDAQSAGLSADVVDDLLLAITELTDGRADDISPRAVVSTGRNNGEWFCDVKLDTPGREAVPVGVSDLGILIGRIVSDRVELAHGDEQLVRFVFGRQRADPRGRIIAAAGELFRTHGVRGSGINAVIERADVAKATFYAHFRSKNDLVRVWLSSPGARWFDHVGAEVDFRAHTPLERLTTFFDVLGEWLARDNYYGCPFLNTATEFRNADHAFAGELANLMAEIEEYFRHAASEAGLPEPDVLAAQLSLLVPGTITTSTARASAEPSHAARSLAERLVTSAAREDR